MNRRSFFKSLFSLMATWSFLRAEVCAIPGGPVFVPANTIGELLDGINAVPGWSAAMNADVANHGVFLVVAYNGEDVGEAEFEFVENGVWLEERIHHEPNQDVCEPHWSGA